MTTPRSEHLGRVAVLLATLGVCLVGATVEAAGKHVAPGAFRCVPANVMECDAEDECQRVAPRNVNLPALFDVNLTGKTVRNDESGRESPIRDVRRANGRITLQGAEGERSWILTIREDSGTMWGAVTGDEEAFVISGACVAR